MSSNIGNEKVCNCKKSNCLKLYCDCFNAGAYCNANKCNCVTCYNNFDHEDRRRIAVLGTLERNPHAFRSKIVTQSEEVFSHQKGCHCKRSNCLKKYCECFQGSVHCSSSCRCKSCLNYVGSTALQSGKFSKPKGASTISSSRSGSESENDGGEANCTESTAYTHSTSTASHSKSTLSEFENVLTAEGFGEICRTLLSTALVMATQQPSIVASEANPDDQRPPAAKRLKVSNKRSVEAAVNTSTASERVLKPPPRCDDSIALLNIFGSSLVNLVAKWDKKTASLASSCESVPRVSTADSAMTFYAISPDLSRPIMHK